MTERSKAIHWGVFALLALGVTALQLVAGEVLGVLLLVVRILILIGLAYFVYTLWRNNRSRLQWLNRRQKLLFYGAGALLVIIVVGSFAPIGWNLLTALMFIVIVGACIFVMWRMWRETEGWY